MDCVNKSKSDLMFKNAVGEIMRVPCCNREGLKRGPWTAVEDEKLAQYIYEHGHGKWHHLSKHAGLQRCGKSCRLRWINYLRPGIKRGDFSKEEEEIILFHHSKLGNKWSKIAKHLDGRTDNEIKNHYNTCLKRRLKETMFVPPPLSSYFATVLEAEAQIARLLIFNQLANNGNINVDLGILLSATNHSSTSLSSLVPNTPPHTSRPMENIMTDNYEAYNVHSSYQHLLQKSQEIQGTSVNFNSEMIFDSGFNNFEWESPNSIPLSGTYNGQLEVPSLSSMVNTNDYGAGLPSDTLMEFQQYSSNSAALLDTPTLQDWLANNVEDNM